MFYELLGQRHDLLCNHSNTDLLVCEDNMLFWLVKISFFHVKADLIFYWGSWISISHNLVLFIYFHLFNIINKNLNFLFRNDNQWFFFLPAMCREFSLLIQQSSLLLLVLKYRYSNIPHHQRKALIFFMVKICFNFIYSLKLGNGEFCIQLLDSQSQILGKVILAGDWDNDDFINLLLFFGRWHFFLSTFANHSINRW